MSVPLAPADENTCEYHLARLLRTHARHVYTHVHFDDFLFNTNFGRRCPGTKAGLQQSCHSWRCPGTKAGLLQSCLVGAVLGLRLVCCRAAAVGAVLGLRLVCAELPQLELSWDRHWSGAELP